MGKRFANFDFLIILAVLVISGFGLTIIWSVAPNLVGQQFLFLILGFFFFFFFSQVDYRVLANLKWFFYLSAIFLLFLTFLIGPKTREVTRWLEIGGLRLQPSEIIKPFLILFFSGFLTKYRVVNLRLLLISLLLLIVPLSLIFKQPDVGNTLVFLAAFLGVIAIAGLRPILVGAGLIFSLVALPFLWDLLKDYQKQRILSFLTPGSDPLGSGYNVLQAMIAVGSGQIFGKGLGRGTQSHLQFLPERHTDFIFASLAEELGFLGSALLIFAYFFLLWRILKIAQETDGRLGTLICAGIFVLILSQVFINIGMNLGLLPITGITLPLVSYGGSSVVSTMISLGIVQSIARQKKKEKTLEIR